MNHSENQVMCFSRPRLLLLLTMTLKDDSVADESHMYQRVKKGDGQDEALRARVYVTPARFLAGARCPRIADSFLHVSRIGARGPGAPPGVCGAGVVFAP